MAESKAVRGVEHPIASDMALVGDTRQELAHKSLPKSYGPNYGYAKDAPSDLFRVEGNNEDYGKGGPC